MVSIRVSVEGLHWQSGEPTLVGGLMQGGAASEMDVQNNSPIQSRGLNCLRHYWGHFKDRGCESIAL